MSKEAHFSITETPEGVQFDITPASKPASFGCMIVGLYGLTAFVAFIVMVQLSGGLLGGVIAAAPLLAGIYFLNRKVNAHDRIPVRMLVNTSGITVGQQFYPSSDIRELIMRFPHDAGGSTMTTYHGSAAAQAGAGVGMELRNRSYALMARLKSSSQPEILAFGLTYNVGDSLLKDVSSALNGRL